MACPVEITNPSLFDPDFTPKNPNPEIKESVELYKIPNEKESPLDEFVNEEPNGLAYPKKPKATIIEKQMKNLVYSMKTTDYSGVKIPADLEWPEIIDEVGSGREEENEPDPYPPESMA